MRALHALAALAILLCGCGDDGDTGSAEPDAGLANLDKPNKRSDIHGAMDPETGVFAVFGGDDGPIVDQRPQAAYRDDTWIFEPAEGWTEVSAAGPSARGRQAVAFDANANRMLLFGGRFRTAGTTGNYTLFNDLWAFDFSARTWTQLDDGAAGPSPRYFATAAYDAASDALYVYGGDTNPSALNVSVSTEVWRFDGAWERVTVSGAAPDPSRLFMGYTHDTKRNALIAYGGQIGDFLTAANRDIYSLDLAIGVWSKLDSGTSGPSGRFSSLMTYDAQGDRYIVMGGHADLGVTNDVWAFNPNGNTWQQLYTGDTFTGAALGCLGNPQEIPKEYVEQDVLGPERRSGGFLGATATGDLWLFGGESDCSDHLDDTWRFSLEGGTWTEVLAAGSGESCLRENNDCTCLCI